MTAPSVTFTFGPLLRDGNNSPIDIDAQDYAGLAGARLILTGCLEIEDNFAALIENYLEFENEHLRIAVRRTVGGDFTQDSIRQDRLILARRFGNVLATARAFLDQLDRTFAHCFRVDRAALKVEKNRQYDERFGYRVMEQVRNVVTHEGRGLQRLSYPHHNRERGMEVRVVPTLNADDLRFMKVKSQVLDELDSRGPVSIVALLRDYIEGLGVVHDQARALSEPPVSSAAELFDTWITKGHERWNDQPGFTIRRPPRNRTRRDHREPETFPVVSSFVELCRRARREDYHLKNLGRAYVSSQVDMVNRDD